MRMRRVILAAVTLGVCSAAAGSAAGQALAPDLTAKLTADVLNRAAFVDRGEVKLSKRNTLKVDKEAPPPTAPAGYADERLELSLKRSWPGAVSFTSESGLEFEVAPHAGLGVGASGGTAEGGAMLMVSKSREQQAMDKLRDMGVKDGASLGDAGRWYLFAAASGRAVGLNMLRGERGWDQAGWTTDPTASLVGDAQIGVGWRKGDMQSSFGVIHREVKGRHMVMGQETRNDTVAAFTFSFRPQR
jgi:hypothetical protein